MARNKQALRRTAQATADGYENFIARVGMQTPNQHSASTYRANFTSRNRMLVEWSYRSSWIIGEAVDAIPDDMTRKGIRITSEIDAKDRGILESQLDELQIWDALNDVLKWSRLYGGAVGFIMIEGQAPMTPLRPETIGKGKFKGILPLDRWMIDPVLTRRIKDMGPDLGKPEFYDVVTTATGIPAWRIHHSRLIRFDGVTLPFQQKMTENEWGMSVVERIWDRLTAFDSATVGAGSWSTKRICVPTAWRSYPNNAACGGGGMSGEYVKARVDNPTVTTVTIGYGGTGASASVGAPGGTTSFGNTIIAKGGLGGNVLAEGTAPGVVGPYGAYTEPGFTGANIIGSGSGYSSPGVRYSGSLAMGGLAAIQSLVRGLGHKPL